MASRGRRRGPSRSGGYRRAHDAPPDAEVLDTETIECEDKTIVLQMKENTQGKFIKMTESKAEFTNVRGHIILSIETCPQLRTKLNEFVADYEHLDPPTGDIVDSRTIKTDKFKGHMSRRLYYVDLRENQRGRFLKISMVTDDKKFIAVPGEVLVDFRDKFAKLLDKFPLTSTTDPSSTSSPVTRSITVDRKTFYFDIVENKRGVFVKVTEVLSGGHPLGHINIPHSSWTKFAEVFTSLAQERPYTEESSGSDEN